MSNDISTVSNPMAELARACEFSRRLQYTGEHYGMDEKFLPQARKDRAKMLPMFKTVKDMAKQLDWWIDERLDLDFTISRVTTLYADLGIRATNDNEGLLSGALRLFESDALGAASGMWVPMRVSPASLELACMKLLATSKFAPKPAELRTACIEAREALTKRYLECAEFCAQFIRADRVLLMLDREEWRRPFLTHQYQGLFYEVLDGGDALFELVDGVQEALQEEFDAEEKRPLIEAASTPPRAVAARSKRPAVKRRFEHGWHEDA